MSDIRDFDKGEFIEQGGLYVDDGCIWYEGVKYLPERTCEVVSVRYDPVYGAVYTLSCCDDEVMHDGEGEPPKHCQHCRARVAS